MPSDPSDDRIGTLIGGRYRIERRLGAGGMGEVYVALDTREEVEVAIKLLNPALANEEQYLERFLREAEVTSLLDHPHVVKAIDSGTHDDGSPYLVMELVAGKSLSAYMRERNGEPLDLPIVISIARQIASALAAAAEINVIHRDLKPANVMIAEAPGGELRVKVLDFGIARFLRSPTYQTLTMTGQVLGTPAYMSPEQAFGERVDLTTDIYSLGAILHALLTGEPPHGRGPEVLARLLAGERERLTEVRPDLGPAAAVIERCLAPAPADRYPSAEALDRDLASLEREGSRTVVDWVRPDILPSLILDRDSVLDTTPAPDLGAAPSPAPRGRALRPSARRAPFVSSERRRFGWWIALALLSVVAGVLVVMVLFGEGRDSTHTGEPVPVLPVMIHGAGVDAGAQSATAPELRDATTDDGALAADAAAADSSAEEVTRAPHCPGDTDWHALIEDGNDNYISAAESRIEPGIIAINARCYSTRSVPTESTLRFGVDRSYHVTHLRFTDPGRLNAAERACVLRSLRHDTRFEPFVSGVFTFDFVGKSLVLRLDHRPACGAR